MARKAIWAIVFASVGAIMSSAAVAQTTTGAPSEDTASNFARNRNVSVRERGRPGYEAVGIHAGGFYVFPRLTADVQYNDNIFASENIKVSDAIFHVVPEVAIKSNWSRHELAMVAHATLNRYADHSTENTTDYGVGASGRLDIARASNLFAGVTYDRLTEPRTSPNSPNAAREPIIYDVTAANFGGVHEFNRLKLHGRVNYADYNYHNGINILGQPLVQDDRDRAEWLEGAQAEYAMSPETSFYLAGSLNQRSYDLHPPQSAFNRDSDGYDVSVGTSFDITRLVRGDLRVGYMHQSYDDPRFHDTGGLSFSGVIDWFPTELTTVNLNGSRSIQEPAQSTASGYISTNVGVRIDHELLRNLLVSGRLSYGDDDYRQQDRNDHRVAAGLSATYLMNPHIGLRLSYDFDKLDSSGTAKTVSFDQNRVTGSLTFQF